MIRIGDRFDWTRTISEDDIRKFAEISGDRGTHHVRPDARGRLIAHGLLTATLPTKLGGDLNFLARTMTFEFLKPVYSGDILTCTGVVDEATPETGRMRVTFSFEVINQQGEGVMRGSSSGVVRKDIP